MAFLSLKASKKFLIILLSFIMFMMGYIFADMTCSMNMKCNNNINIIKYFKKLSYKLDEINNMEDLKRFNKNFNMIITQLAQDYCLKEISDKMIMDKLDSVTHTKKE